MRSPLASISRPRDRDLTAPELQAFVIATAAGVHTATRPSAKHGQADVYTKNPTWQNLILFYEYFHGDSGRGVGASHQTGWTALVTRLLEKHAQGR